MSTPFQEAMQAFVAAEREYYQAYARWKSEDGEGAHLAGVRDARAANLAQAGDRLESVLRQMMRDSVNAAAERFRPRQPWP